VRDLYIEPVNGILSALSLAVETVCGFEKVGDGTVFYDKDDKPIYSFNLEGHATGYVSGIISAEALSATAKYSRPLGRNPQLVSVARLLAQSMDTESDQLRSFLSAWAGLEIFINKVFKTYEESFLRNLTGDITLSIRGKYLDRIKSVMHDKYRLSDKFLIISSQLAHESAEDDLPDFMKTKSIRDNLLHGENVKEDQLETSQIQRLLRKYLRLHVELCGR
jgi:hypothetical protein